MATAGQFCVTSAERLKIAQCDPAFRSTFLLLILLPGVFCVNASIALHALIVCFILSIVQYVCQLFFMLIRFYPFRRHFLFKHTPPRTMAKCFMSVPLTSTLIRTISQRWPLLSHRLRQCAASDLQKKSLAFLKIFKS